MRTLPLQSVTATLEADSDHVKAPTKPERRRRAPAPEPSSLGAIPLTVAGMALVGALVWASTSEAITTSQLLHVVVILGKLVAAAGIGLLVTAVAHRTEKPLAPPMEHAQVLLCVAGAMMMLIVGDSLARAFGIVGAASLIRFRTPVKDPKAVTILFLLLGLGMATGLGAYALAGLGTGFLCLFLVVIGRAAPRPTYTLIVRQEVDAPYPCPDIHNVLASMAARVEPREITRDGELVVRYLITFGPATTLDAVNQALLNHAGADIRSITWESAKNEK
jgi:hypothetical protein